MSVVVKSANVFLAVAAAALGACDGSGQGPVEAARPLERDAARSLVGQIAAISEQPTQADRLLQATDITPLLTLAAPARPPLAPFWGEVSSNALTGCLLATGTAATLTECELGDHVIEGTWSVHHQRTHVQLVDVFVDDAGRRGSLWIDANLTAAPDAGGAPGGTIDGLVELSLMWTTGGHSQALDASIRIEGLAIDGPGCATAGAVTIQNSSDGSTTALWFGPACHDVHISRQAAR